MTGNHSPVNPLFASQSPRRAAQSAAKLGGYGGMAVAAWLVTAVATGYGVAGADTTGTSSESSSTSSASSTSSTTGESSTGSEATSTTATSGTESTSTSGGSTSTSAATSSSTQVGSGVTVSSSGGAHTSSTETEASTAPTPPSAELPEDTSGVETQPEPSEPATSGEGAQQPTSTPTHNNSNSVHTATVDATTAPSSPATSVGAVKAVATVAKPSATVTDSDAAAPAAQAVSANTLSSVPTTQTLAAAATPAAPTAALVATPAPGLVGLFNGIVTNLLKPFLAPAPNTPEPVTPAVWAVLAWVRRNLFNQSPTIAYNPTTSVQTGQTVTGNIGATDPEGDTLTYKVIQAPKYGTLTIDQATGNFTYTPNEIDYDSVQTDSFKVSVTDGNNVLGLFSQRSAKAEIEVSVLNPTVQRVILNLPAGITKPVNPRYSEDGQSIYFSGTPAAGGRGEIYQINIDGTDAKCLTCGLIAPAVAGTDPASPINILKPVPFYDGTGRVVVLLNNPDPRYAIFEPAGYNGIGSPARLVNVFTPDGGGANLPGLPFPGGIINREREMRPSPDGTHVLFTRIVIGQTGNFQALPIVGALTPNGDHYDVTNARVVWPTGESKQWTPDGKGVIIQGGAIDAGNIDDIMVDLSGQTGDILFPGSPFRGTRVTGNLDYDEDIDMSPNKQWITVGSTRGLEALTPMTRIVRQNFLPVYLAAIYDQYADGQVRNVSNQNWAVAVEDDLNRENGIPLFVQDDPTTPGVDEGDGWISRSMPSWNADGTAVTFWESGNGDEHGIAPTESRIVIANLKYTTSVGPVGDTTTVFNTSAFPDLTTYVAKTTPLPPTGTYNGVGGGTAVVSEAVNPTTFQTTRTVKYTGYVNEDGLILNGTESAIYGPSQLSVTYLADIDVTDASGANRGALDANAVVTLLPTQSVTGFITSTLDGDTQTIPDPAKVEAAKTGA